MKKLSYFLPLLLLGVVCNFNTAKAADEVLPSADDPFWNIMADLERPDDPTCFAKAKNLLDSLNLGYDTTARAQATCTGVASVMQIKNDMASDGVTTNLFDEANWHHVDNLYFEKAGYGKIEFSKEIDFMSYNFMLFMESIRNKLNIDLNKIGLDADLVTSLKNAGAVLTMYNVSDFQDPTILVDDDVDTEGVVSGLTYDKTTKTITFNAAHFTTFTAVEKSSLQSTKSEVKKPKITRVTWRKYTDKDGKQKIKLKIRGKYFQKKARVKLGKEGESITWKNSKKIEANFEVKELLEHGEGNLLYLKVINPGNKSQKFGDRIDISKMSGKKD